MAGKASKLIQTWGASRTQRAQYIMNPETIRYSTLANKIKKCTAYICAWDLDGCGADVITYNRSREASLHYFLVTDIPQDAMRTIHSPSGRHIVMVRI